MNKNIAGKIDWNKNSSPDCQKEAEEIRFNEMINGCKNQKNSSQEKLYKQFYGYALGIAYAYSLTKEDAVEVVNDSFMKVFKHIDRYRPSEPFKPWFRKIVVNTTIDKARANKRFQAQVDIDDHVQSAPADVETALNAKQIYKLLNELPDLLRFVFNMYEIEGYSHREIAETLSIAESSSRTYLTRAKQQLRHHYKNLFDTKQ